ncbi:hypothetical protein [Longimicrobium sp.]|uniref:hypothetical protein n=1 Tax=Longimicrobium sp. TaxID=2029185 RepID=UPI002E328386|nr:hypothetical protein [Longimicrobium sp.]HEX6038275.1 hypothetical protein [Longimicrobium sp.]
MTDFTPATRPATEHGGEEPLLDSFLREAIPEIKLALGDLIDRDNSRAIPDKYVKLLPLTTLVVTLRPDAARAVAPMAADLEGDLTDSVMRHGSLYDRDYRVRLREAGQKGAPLFRVAVQPAGEPEPAPIAAAPPAEPTVAAMPPRPPAPAAPPIAETLFAGRSPEFVDPDATRVEGIAPAAPAAPRMPATPSFPAGRYELVAEEEDGTELERFPISQAITTVGRQTDNAALRSDIQLTNSDRVSRRQLALVFAHRDGREGFDVYNLGLNSIHAGEREVSGANDRSSALQLEGMEAHSLFVPPGQLIRIGGHGPFVRIREIGGAKKDDGPAEIRVEPEVEDDPDRTQFG